MIYTIKQNRQVSYNSDTSASSIKFLNMPPIDPKTVDKLVMIQRLRRDCGGLGQFFIPTHYDAPYKLVTDKCMVLSEFHNFLRKGKETFSISDANMR